MPQDQVMGITPITFCNAVHSRALERTGQSTQEILLQTPMATQSHSPPVGKVLEDCLMRHDLATSNSIIDSILGVDNKKVT